MCTDMETGSLYQKNEHSANFSLLDGIPDEVFLWHVLDDCVYILHPEHEGFKTKKGGVIEKHMYIALFTLCFTYVRGPQYKVLKILKIDDKHYEYAYGDLVEIKYELASY